MQLNYLYTENQRNSQSYTRPYRFGFNGKEKDDEVKGSGNSYDFGARIYDSRLGRWLSTDPMQTDYTSLSPYHFTANNPIMFVEIDGKVFDFSAMTEAQKKQFQTAVLELSKESEIFRVMYEAIENSNDVVKVTVTEYIKGEELGSYTHSTATVDIRTFNTYVMAQELFHSYQDLSEVEAKSGTRTVTDMEAEGDLASFYIQRESGIPLKETLYPPPGTLETTFSDLGIPQTTVKSELIKEDGYSNPVPNFAEVSSPQFNIVYQQYKKDFVIHNKQNNPQPSYTGAVSDAKPNALIQLIEKADRTIRDKQNQIEQQNKENATQQPGE